MLRQSNCLAQHLSRQVSLDLSANPRPPAPRSAVSTTMTESIHVSFQWNEPEFSSFEAAVSQGHGLEARTELSRQITPLVRGRTFEAYNLYDTCIQLRLGDIYLECRMESGIVAPEVVPQAVVRTDREYVCLGAISACGQQWQLRV